MRSSRPRDEDMSAMIQSALNHLTSGVSNPSSLQATHDWQQLFLQCETLAQFGTPVYMHVPEHASHQAVQLIHKLLETLLMWTSSYPIEDPEWILRRMNQYAKFLFQSTQYVGLQESFEQSLGPSAYVICTQIGLALLPPIDSSSSHRLYFLMMDTAAYLEFFAMTGTTTDSSAVAGSRKDLEEKLNHWIQSIHQLAQEHSIEVHAIAWQMVDQLTLENQQIDLFDASSALWKGPSEVMDCQLYRILYWINDLSKHLFIPLYPTTEAGDNCSMMESKMSTQIFPLLFWGMYHSSLDRVHNLVHIIYLKLIRNGKLRLDTCYHSNNHQRIPMEWKFLPTYIEKVIQSYPTEISSAQLSFILASICMNMPETSFGIHVVIFLSKQIAQRFMELVQLPTNNPNQLLLPQAEELIFILFVLLKTIPLGMLIEITNIIQDLFHALHQQQPRKLIKLLEAFLYQAIAYNCEKRRRTWLMEWFLQVVNQN